MSITPIEEKIITLLQKKDKQAINLLYKHYANSLFGVIIKVVKDHAIAEDALQETFIKIWKNSASYNSKKAKLFTWLFRIAHNTAIDKLRNYKKTPEQNIQIEISNVYTLPTTNLNQDVLDIKKHLGTLDEKYQIVIHALFFEGMTHQEASEALNMPLGTIKSRLKIGLRELKKIYDN